MKHTKKGFTLIEMLVVIAIIAIIVSIGMPMIQSSLIKSAAARNAANLRAVEGQLSTMRVSNSDAFERLDFTELEDAEAGNKDDFWGSLGNLVGVMGEKYNSSTADENGVLTVSEEIIVYDVPGAAKMTAVDSAGKIREIEEDAPMSVYISNKGIYATYYGIPKEAFSEIAETGEFNGEFALTQQEKEDAAKEDLKEEIGQVIDKHTCAVCGEYSLTTDNSRCSGHYYFNKCAVCSTWCDSRYECPVCNPKDVYPCNECVTCTGWVDVQNNKYTFWNQPDGKCDTCSHNESAHNVN